MEVLVATADDARERRDLGPIASARARGAEVLAVDELQLCVAQALGAGGGDHAAISGERRGPELRRLTERVCLGERPSVRGRDRQP